MEIEMIDDKFWLQYAKTHVDNAISIVNAAADKLDPFLTWVWSIYTLFIAATMLLSSVGDDWTYRAFLALPVFLVPLAKYVCIRVQMPVFAQFYENIPDSIVNDLYARSIGHKRYLFKWAIGLAILAFLNIGTALFLYRIGHTDDFQLKAYLIGTTNTIRVHGIASANKPVNVTILGWYPDSSLHSFDFKMQSDKTGLLDTLFVNCGFKTITNVYGKWDKGNGKIQIISSP